jgi:hypothetical protein
MGWKNVRDHYGLEYQIQTLNGDILIGSKLLPKLIQISSNGKLLTKSLSFKNASLNALFDRLKSDPDKLKSLVCSEDVFSDHTFSVWTFSGGVIIEKQCEEIGEFLNCTDGTLQDPDHFTDKEKAIERALLFSENTIDFIETEITEVIRRLNMLIEKRRSASQDLKDLRHLINKK